MSQTREFPTADVLGATSGILLRDVGGIYEVLNHVLGDDLFTHQLPAASRAAEPTIIAQHPWLADVNDDLQSKAGDVPALMAALDAITTEHGETLALAPAVDPDWRRGNAISDLVDLVGGKPIVVVDLPESA